MNSEWREVTWGDVSELNYGRAVPKECDCGSHTVPVYGTSGIFGYTCAPQAQGPRVVVGRKGTLGVQLVNGPFWTVDTAFWMEPSVDLDPIWAFYRLSNLDFKGEDSGTAIPSLTRDHFYSIPLSLPPLEEQRKVASVLSDLDALIEANRKQIDVLSQLSDAIYKSAIYDSSLTQSIGEIAHFENSKRVPLSAAQRLQSRGDFPYYGATSQMDTVGDFIFDAERVLVGEDGSVVKSDGSPFIQYVWGKYWVNNHAHVLSGVGISTALLRVILRNANVSSVITGAVQPKLSMGNLKSIIVDVPEDAQCDEQIQALAALERSIIAEIDSLSKTKAALLPLLVTGKLSVGMAA